MFSLSGVGCARLEAVGCTRREAAVQRLICRNKSDKTLNLELVIYS